LKAREVSVKTVYLVPHTHFDVAWAFTKEDYYQINELIYSKALELMRKSEFKFCLEQCFLLKAFEERNPELWSGLKEMIQAGKLEIVDGQWLMPDAMLPSGEVMIREILFGKRYAKEKFGVDVPVAWAADTFGLNAQLPQVYKKSGYKWLAFRRGLGKSVGSRVSEFLWRGLDGTIILSHWMPRGYRAGLELDKLEHPFNILSKVAATSQILMPSGSGVTIPQEETPDAVDNWNKTHRDSFMKIATPIEFFTALEQQGKEFEVVDGEMYDDHVSDVFPDVCSSRIWIILGTRECERLIVTTEGVATIAWLLGKQYPGEVMKRNWEKLLYIAFHDVIAGCGIDEIYDEVKEHFNSMEQELGELTKECKEYIVGKQEGGLSKVVVFNVLPWWVTNWVEVELDTNPGSLKGPGLKDDYEVECDVLEIETDSSGVFTRAKLGFMAKVPPLGYKIYDIIERTEKAAGKVEVKGNKLVTPFFTLLVDDNTGIVEVYDNNGRLLVRGNELIIDDEIGDLYFHHSRLKQPIHTEGGEGLLYGDFKPVSFNIEANSLKAKITFDEAYYSLRWPYRLREKYKPLFYRHKSMEVHKEITVYRDIPRIDFALRIDNKHPDVRIRNRFDTKIMQPDYFRETQFGVIGEPGKFISDVAFKVPCLSWVDCSAEDRGVTFFGKGIPINEMGEGYVYLTLLRSVSTLSADGSSGPFVPTPKATEIGSYTYEYALYPHPGDWKEANSFRRADDFSYPLTASQVCLDEAAQRERSFLRLEPDNLILSALKKAEDNDGVILRFFETKGEATRATISFLPNLVKASIVDLLEKEEHQIEVRGNEVELEVKPFEIVTLKLKFQGSW
jgi:alpha-mannosidase